MTHEYRPPVCDECPQRAMWKVNHQEYGDHVSPNFACARHLSRVCVGREYSEGDALTVTRILFDA